MTHTDAAADLTDAEQDRRVQVAWAAAMDIARSNFVTAIDQAGEYETTEDAIDTYWENALDTALETGVDSDAVNSAYSQLAAAHAAA